MPLKTPRLLLSHPPQTSPSQSRRLAHRQTAIWRPPSAIQPLDPSFSPPHLRSPSADAPPPEQRQSNGRTGRSRYGPDPAFPELGSGRRIPPEKVRTGCARYSPLPLGGQPAWLLSRCPSPLAPAVLSLENTGEREGGGGRNGYGREHVAGVRGSRAAVLASVIWRWSHSPVANRPGAVTLPRAEPKETPLSAAVYMHSVQLYLPIPTPCVDTPPQSLATSALLAFLHFREVWRSFFSPGVRWFESSLWHIKANRGISTGGSRAGALISSVLPDWLESG